MTSLRLGDLHHYGYNMVTHYAFQSWFLSEGNVSVTSSLFYSLFLFLFTCLSQILEVGKMHEVP